MKPHPALRSIAIVLGLTGVLLLAACGDSSVADTTDHLFEGAATGVAQFGGDGNHDGLSNVMVKIEQFLARYKWQLVGASVGLIGGYLYWYFIGCTSGTCPIQANWHTSTLYGGLLGYFVSDLKKKPQPKKEDDPDGAV